MKKHSSEVLSAILTIGHSTHTLEDFISLLQTNNAKLVVDVRTVPRSRYNPQFNQETLPESLKIAGISYAHMTGLGGLRHPRPDSPNNGWRNSSFRGFADYMQTEEFETNMQKLIELSMQKQIAMMCAEALPWRCHRSLIADALLVRKIQVEHIMGKKRRQVHSLTPWALVNGMYITYPPEPAQVSHEAKKELN